MVRTRYVQKLLMVSGTKTAWHYGRRMTGEMFGEGAEEFN